MSKVELIERYVHEVGRQLPKKLRADVKVELRSLLSDMVEDRAQTKVDKADEEIIVEVLQEMGRPEEVAASYRPRDHYLIGPKLYPMFILVVKAVMGALGVAYLAGLVFTHDSSVFPRDLGQYLLSTILGYTQAVLSSLGSIMLVFAFLERVLPEHELAMGEVEEAWDPGTLPAIDDPTRMNRRQLVWGIIGAAFALVLFNVFPDKIGVVFNVNGEWFVMPVLSENFLENVVPWLNVLWLVTIVFNFYLLRQQGWTVVARWLYVGLQLLPVVVLYVLVTGGQLLDMPDIPGASGLNNLNDLLNRMLRLGLMIGIFGALFAAVKNIFDVWRPPGQEAEPDWVVGKVGS